RAVRWSVAPRIVRAEHPRLCGQPGADDALWRAVARAAAVRLGDVRTWVPARAAVVGRIVVRGMEGHLRRRRIGCGTLSGSALREVAEPGIERQIGRLDLRHVGTRRTAPRPTDDPF